MPELEQLPTQIDETVSEETVLNYILDRFEQSAAEDQPFKDRCMDNVESYAAVTPSGWPYHWELILPESMMALTDAMEQTMSNVFPREVPFDLRDENEVDLPGPLDDMVRQMGEVRTELLREKMKNTLREMKYKVHMYRWFFEGAFHGNAVVGTFAMPKVKMNAQGQMQMKMRPEMRVFSRLDCFPAPLGCHQPDIQRQQYFIVRDFVPLAEARMLATINGWANVDKLDGVVDMNLDTGRSSARSEQHVDIYQRMRLAGFDVKSDAMTGAGTVRFVEFLYYFETQPLTDYCRAFGVVANRRHVMCTRPNMWGFAHKPLADIRWGIWDTQAWQGLGLIEKSRPYVDSLNIANAQQNDQSEFRLRPHRLVGTGAMDAKQMWRLKPQPGAITPVTNAEKIGVLEMPDADFNTQNRMNSAMAGIQRAAKINDVAGLAMSRESRRVKGTGTLGELDLLQDSSKRASLFQLAFGTEQGVAEQLNQTLAIIQRVTIEPETLNLEQPNEKLMALGMGNRLPLSPQDIQGNYQCYVVGITQSMDTPEKIKALLDILSLPQFAQNPEVLQRIKWVELLKLVAEGIVPGVIGRVMMTDLEMQQKQQQDAMQMIQKVALMAKLGVGPGQQEQKRKPAMAGAK